KVVRGQGTANVRLTGDDAVCLDFGGGSGRFALGRESKRSSAYTNHRGTRPAQELPTTDVGNLDAFRRLIVVLLGAHPVAPMVVCWTGGREMAQERFVLGMKSKTADLTYR